VLVFVLRAHSPVQISSSALTSPFTGPFRFPDLDGKTAGDLFSAISKRSFNMNISKDLREAQRKRIASLNAGNVPTPSFHVGVSQEAKDDDTSRIT